MPPSPPRRPPPHSLSAPARRMETALYVARLAGELAVLAGQAKLDMTAYFLNMAQMEASSAAFEGADQPRV